MPETHKIFFESDLDYCPIEKLKNMLEDLPVNDETIKRYREILEKLKEHEVYIRTIRQNVERHIREYNIKDMINDAF